MHLDRPVCFSLLCARPHRADALSDDARLTCLSVWCRAQSRTERRKQTKIVSEAAHVTRDSVSKVKGQLAGGGGILWQPPAQLVYNGAEMSSCTWLLSNEWADVNAWTVVARQTTHCALCQWIVLRCRWNFVKQSYWSYYVSNTCYHSHTVSTGKQNSSIQH